MSTATLPPPLFDLDPSERVERKRAPRPQAEDTLPPPLFEPSRAERPWEDAVLRHCIHSTDVDLTYFCGDDRYGYLADVPPRHDAWVWHCCTQPLGHDGRHVCDRCPETWNGPATRHLSTLPRRTA